MFVVELLPFLSVGFLGGGVFFFVDGVELHSWSSWLFLGVFDLGLVFLIVYCRIFAARFCWVDMVVEVHSCATSELRLFSTCVFWWDVFIRVFVCCQSLARAGLFFVFLFVSSLGGFGSWLAVLNSL